MNRRVFSRILTLSALSIVALTAGAVLPAGPTATAPIASAWAFDETSKADINVDGQNLILRGYDAVAYFTASAPVKGSPEFSATHDGATYHFATAENRDLFVADPAKYAPQYGGFCAMGVALGKKLDGDPTLYRVVDGKLYLNVNADAQRVWLSDIAGHVDRANQTWPSLLGKSPSEIN